MTDRAEARRAASWPSAATPPRPRVGRNLFGATGHRLAAIRGVSTRRRDRRFRVVPLSFFQIANAAALVGSAILIVMLVLDPYLELWRSGLPEPLEKIFQFLTRVGESDWMLLSTALVFLASLALDGGRLPPRARLRHWSRAATAGYLFMSVAASGLAAVVLKYLFGRARPLHFDDVGAYSFQFISSEASWASFPSGHATTAMALAVALGLLYPRLFTAFACAGFWVALSRVVIGAHYPSDLIAGCFLGGVCAWLMARALAQRRLVFCFDTAGRVLPRSRKLRAGS